MGNAFAAQRAQQIAEEAEAHFTESPDRLFIPGMRAAQALPDTGSNVGFKYKSVDEAFPPVPADVAPLGSLVLLQLRQPLATTTGGLIIDAETRKTELDNTQVAKVIAVGDLAFRNRQTGDAWPEGAWCQAGDFVRIGKYQGDRWAVPFQTTVQSWDSRHDCMAATIVEDRSVFILIKDLAIMGRYPDAEAAMAAKAFI
jgi:co-chaperonin GroES (HSP10)